MCGELRLVFHSYISYTIHTFVMSFCTTNCRNSHQFLVYFCYLSLHIWCFQLCIYFNDLQLYSARRYRRNSVYQLSWGRVMFMRASVAFILDICYCRACEYIWCKSSTWYPTEDKVISCKMSLCDLGFVKSLHKTHRVICTVMLLHPYRMGNFISFAVFAKKN